ncbi:hypothetical protein [Taklimakanibacter lacteus]|uniref:hypothetical protein n=1 Tax=Taklimakanibacter lacteus TaxID=2268456 RepID=UPI0013C4BBE5
MKREATRRLDRQLALEAVTGNIFAVLLGLAIAAGLLFWVTNVPVSRQTIEGRFVRWTVHQSDKGQSLPRVFVDFPDGHTTAVVAWADWRPPEVGSAVRVEEETLRWYGKYYRLVP